jgi:O-Antigen ligase
MNPRWKARLAAAAAAALAVACGWWIANGSYGLPTLIGGVGGGALIVMLLGVPLDTAILSGLVVGYIVGNRGFAQFSLLPGMPLFPGETGLALCGGWLIVSSAFSRKLPFRVDALNAAVLIWIVVGSIRIIPDVRANGAVALRDFAMVYYALFFFVAQAQARSSSNRRFLTGSLLAATVVIIPLFELFRRFPDFFINTLTVRGIPLIYIKGDLIATFLAVGIVLTHGRWERTRNISWLACAVLAFVAIVVSENRASLVGLALITLWLTIRRRWSLLRLNLLVAFAAMVLLLGAVMLGLVSPRDNPVIRFADQVGSMVDFTGNRSYRSQDIEYKSDNNQFRLVWWRTVTDETVTSDPWLGLGFGHDLAAGFLRQYFPEGDDVFSARSPHSIIVTVFARMGVVGLVGFLAIVIAMSVRTDRALRSSTPGTYAISLWLSAWVILVSACFGVVLEGPMGAIVFWTILGMANAASAEPTEPEPASADEQTPRSLNAPADPAEVAAGR